MTNEEAESNEDKPELDITDPLPNKMEETVVFITLYINL